MLPQVTGGLNRTGENDKYGQNKHKGETERKAFEGEAEPCCPKKLREESVRFLFAVRQGQIES